MKDIYPITIAVAGIGGFAEAHHRACLNLERENIGKVVATCDPAGHTLETLCCDLEFAQRGVTTHRNITDLLAANHTRIDLGIIASPIHTHGSIHHAFIERGIPCYMEKPPTLDPMELQLMIERDARSPVPTNVGFAHVNSNDYHALKCRIVSGEFGTLRRSTLLGMAPRAASYFKRNDWAGRLFHNENLLLDSCLGNALSHSLNASIFFAGTSAPHHRARPVSMHAELYRANDIEGCDTIFATARLENDVEFRVAATHAADPHGQILEQRMEFDHATVTITSSNRVRIDFKDGRTESSLLITGMLRESLLDYVSVFLDPSRRVKQTLQDSIAFVETHALLYVAAGRIHSIPEDALATRDEHVFLPDFAEVARRFLREGTIPSSQNISWSAPGGTASVHSISSLRSIAHSMRQTNKPSILNNP